MKDCNRKKNIVEEKIKIELTEDELNSILLCLDARASQLDVAAEWRKEYKRLADELNKKIK